jgi:hypothetical protein
VRFKNNSSLVVVHLFWINSLNQGGIFFFIIKKIRRRRKEGGKEKSEKL